MADITREQEDLISKGIRAFDLNPDLSLEDAAEQIIINLNNTFDDISVPRYEQERGVTAHSKLREIMDEKGVSDVAALRSAAETVIANSGGTVPTPEPSMLDNLWDDIQVTAITKMAEFDRWWDKQDFSFLSAKAHAETVEENTQTDETNEMSASDEDLATTNSSGQDTVTATTSGAETEKVEQTVFKPTGEQVPENLRADIATIEAALPTMVALAKDAGATIPDRITSEPDGFLDSNEMEILNGVADTIRRLALEDDQGKVLLRGDENTSGYSEKLGVVLQIGLNDKFAEVLADPSKADIHDEIRYFQANITPINEALANLHQANQLKATAGTFETTMVEASAVSSTATTSAATTTTTTPATTSTSTTTTTAGQITGNTKTSIRVLEGYQELLHGELNKMSPFIADLMEKPNPDGVFEDGEKRNLSAMIMLLKKMDGEGNPNGEYNKEIGERLKESILTKPEFQMIRDKLGLEAIDAEEYKQLKAAGKTAFGADDQDARVKKADDMLFMHLNLLHQEKMLDPNASTVTAANLAFDKIREYLPESVKAFLQDMLENTSIGKMVMGVAAAKGVNLERLWKEPELQEGQTEAEYLEGKKRDFLAQGFDEYLEKAEEELKAEGADNPEFADILARAQENIKEDIEENKLSGVMKKALGDSYDELKDDLLVAVEATTGATTKEEAQQKLMASLEGVAALELDESIRIEKRAEEIINVVGAGASVFTQPASQSTTLEEEEEEAALSSSTVNTVAAAVATSATATIPEVDQEAVDPAKVSTLGSEEHSKGVVLEYDRDPNEYVIKNVESEGRVKAILEAIAAMDEDKRPYNPEDLIRRTDDSGEIIDLAYKEHNGALEKLAVAAQLDHLISSGEDTIYMSQIEHQITSDNLPQIEAFLQKNGVPEEQVEAAVTAAQSLIDQEVDGKSVMSAFFGNWDQIRISEIRALVEEIEPEREISVVEDVPEPEPFNPEHVDLSRRGGDVTLAVGPMPDTTPRPPVSDNTNLFNNVSGVDPYGACQMYSVTANTRRNTATSSGCDSRPDRYSAFRRFDPNDPDGPGEMPVDWRIFGRHTPEERFDTSTTYDKGGLNQRTAYGKDIRTVRNMFPNPGQRRLGEQVVKDFYDFREKMENDGNLNPETNHVLEQVSQRQMAFLRQPGLSYSKREQEINALRQQLHDDYNAKYGSGRQVAQVEIDKENMFEPVVGKQAIGGYAAQIEDIFGGNEQMKELALEQLEGFESKVDRILESDMSPEQAKAAIRQELRTLDGNLDNLYNIKAMIDDRGIALYEQEIKDTIGETGPYAQRAEQAIREFQERVSIISADTTFTTSEKLQDATMLHRMLEDELDTIYVEKQQEEYTIALQASDTTGTTIDPETLEQNAGMDLTSQTSTVSMANR